MFQNHSFQKRKTNKKVLSVLLESNFLTISNSFLMQGAVAASEGASF